MVFERRSLSSLALIVTRSSRTMGRCGPAGDNALYIGMRNIRHLIFTINTFCSFLETCSVPNEPSWTNPGAAYPNKHAITCPSGYKVYYRACYKVFTMQKSFDEADAFCAGQASSISGWNGTSVVSSIWDEYEDNFIYSMLYEGFQFKVNDPLVSIHLGLKIDSTQSDLSERLMWYDNRTVSWSNWGQGEPVIGSGLNCAFVERFLDFPKA